jgi:acyl carrier protein
MQELITEKLQTIQEWLVDWIAKEANIEKSDVSLDEPFVNFGLGSRQAVILSADLEDWLNKKLDVSVAWEYPTIRELSNFLITVPAEG